MQGLVRMNYKAEWEKRQIKNNNKNSFKKSSHSREIMYKNKSLKNNLW